MLIAFSGKKFAGKDTAAEILIKKHGFKRIGLADKLKDICSEVFNIPREDMDAPSKKESAFEREVSFNVGNLEYLKILISRDGFDFSDEIFTEVCKKFAGKKLTSIRDMLQTVGTDICRNFVKDDIWLSYVKKELELHPNIVVTDARFKNERDYFKKLGATLVLITRPNNPSENSHISENQIGDDSEYDVLVTNDGSIHALQSDMSMWFESVHYERLRYSRK
jgi:hypothetical protein